MQRGAEGEPLPKDAVVLRGGSDMTTLHLTDRFLDHARYREARGLDPEYALSANSIPGLAVDQLALRAHLVHPKVRVTTVGALADAGFCVEPTPGRQHLDGHCSVYLSRGRDHLPHGVDLARFTAAFSQPIPNAGQRKARGQR